MSHYTWLLSQKVDDDNDENFDSKSDGDDHHNDFGDIWKYLELITLDFFHKKLTTIIIMMMMITITFWTS